MYTPSIYILGVYFFEIWLILVNICIWRKYMTRQKMAEEYTNKIYRQYKDKHQVDDNGEPYWSGLDVEDAFLAGMDATHWHDLREDPNDLPIMIQDERCISDTVYMSIENWGTEIGHYDFTRKCWVVICCVVNLSVSAWTEIPVFNG